MKNKELKEWLELGWDKKQAKRWSKAGWEYPEDACCYYMAGWDDPVEAKKWFNSGWTRRDKRVNDIIRTDKEVATMALEWYEQGWDDPVEAYIYKFFKRYDYPVKRDKILKNKNGGNKNEIQITRS